MKVSIGHEEFEVQVTRSRRRTCEIRISPEGALQVRGPLKISDKKLKELLQDKSDWIKAKLEAMRKRPPMGQAREFTAGKGYPYRGQDYPLQILESPHKPRPEVRLTAAGFLITAPVQDPVLIRGALEKWCRKKAGELLPDRVRDMALRMGLKYGRVAVKDQKKRWGSCSSRGNVNLNWRLIQMPAEVMDSVIIHELAHLVHPNHSADYYRYLSLHNPRHKEHDRWLKERGRELFL